MMTKSQKSLLFKLILAPTPNVTGLYFLNGPLVVTWNQKALKKVQNLLGTQQAGFSGKYILSFSHVL